MKALPTLKSVPILCIAFSLSAALSSKLGAAETSVSGESSVKAASLGDGGGSENCIRTSGDNNNDTVFTNSCPYDLNVTIAGKNGMVWAPGLLHSGGSMAHDNGNAPFRWFACIPPNVAFDSNNQNQQPNLNSADYVCK